MILNDDFLAVSPALHVLQLRCRRMDERCCNESTHKVKE